MQIKIENLTKVYGEHSSALLALSELDLEVNQGEILIIKGPNGSGKSTLISILSGELAQTVGQISINNESGNTPVISVVKQFENLIDELTIQEHFEKLNKVENLNLISDEILQSRSTHISRGQAQKVAVALALSSKTDLLLADEPTGALSQEESDEIYEFIRNTARNHNTAVLLVTHDENAEKYADRVIRLRDGRVGEVWHPGEAEQQMISKKGWLRIPDEVLDGLNPSVQISQSSKGAIIEGRSSLASIKKFTSEKRSINNAILINAKNLTTGYGQKPVSKELNFEIQENSIFCIYGKSGIGKTTLLKSICNLQKIISGQINKPDDLFIPYFNIEQPYGLELTLNQLIKDDKIITDLLLEDIANRALKTYSGGQLQRAIIALALSNENEVIALDEPTSALDDQMCELVISVLRNSPKTLITTSHDPRLREVATETLEL